MKKFVAGFLSGALLFGIGGAFAVNSIYDNPYKIFVNGEEKQIQGYNVDDYSYFKLRDIADAVGGFAVDFKDDTIQLYKDGYVPKEAAGPGLELTAEMQEFLTDCAMRIPSFTQEDLKKESFAREFIFYFYTSKEYERMSDGGAVPWSEEQVRAQYRLLFGCEMPEVNPGPLEPYKSLSYEDGMYFVGVSNFGEESYIFSDTIHTTDGIDVVFNRMVMYENEFFGTTTLSLKKDSNENGYVITSSVSTDAEGSVIPVEYSSATSNLGIVAQNKKPPVYAPDANTDATQAGWIASTMLYEYDVKFDSMVNGHYGNPKFVSTKNQNTSLSGIQSDRDTIYALTDYPSDFEMELEKEYTFNGIRMKRTGTNLYAYEFSIDDLKSNGIIK